MDGDMREILILGNGGAVSDGLPYNGFLINRSILVEAPPDIMPSLRRSAIDPQSINTIFISHVHADHIFGLPFFLLQRFMDDVRYDKHGELVVIGPPGIGAHAKKLMDMAFGEMPAMKWMERCVNFTETGDGLAVPLIPGCTSTCARMDHFSPTWGFVTECAGKAFFAYIPDTLWCPGVTDILERAPEDVLIDLNGEADDNVPVHISEPELVDWLAQHDSATVFWGTHLKRDKTSTHPRIRYPRPGQRIIPRS